MTGESIRRLIVNMWSGYITVQNDFFKFEKKTISREFFFIKAMSQKLLYIWYIVYFFRKHWIPALKHALTGLWQFLITKSPLKMTKNIFHFTEKSLFVLKF